MVAGKRLKISRKNSNIKGLNLTENFGQHNALLAGLNLCSGDNVITLDDDLLQFS